MSKHRAILSTYFANVRSILEYCSVVWSGAARTHIQRIERVHGRSFWHGFVLDAVHVVSHSLTVISLITSA